MKRTTTNVRVTEQVHRDFKAACATLHITMADYLRDAMDTAIIRAAVKREHMLEVER